MRRDATRCALCLTFAITRILALILLRVGDSRARADAKMRRPTHRAPVGRSSTGDRSDFFASRPDRERCPKWMAKKTRVIKAASEVATGSPINGRTGQEGVATRGAARGPCDLPNAATRTRSSNTRCRGKKYRFFPNSAGECLTEGASGNIVSIPIGVARTLAAPRRRRHENPQARKFARRSYR
jgi:hypothetical protein